MAESPGTPVGFFKFLNLYPISLFMLIDNHLAYSLPVLNPYFIIRQVYQNYPYLRTNAIRSPMLCLETTFHMSCSGQYSTVFEQFEFACTYLTAHPIPKENHPGGFLKLGFAQICYVILVGYHPMVFWVYSSVDQVRL